MSLKTVIEIDNEPVKEYGFNTNSLVISESDLEVLPPEQPKKKRGPGRPSANSNANTYTDDSTIVKANKSSSTESIYEKGYNVTTKLLYGSIQQSETIYNNIENELQDLRDHPAKGGKIRGQIMSEYMNTQVSLINTKIQAIRELDNIRNKINDLNLKRYQLDKDANDENSDKAVMDAYYAFINSANYGLPRAQAPLSPSTINTGINLAGAPIQSNMISSSEIVPVSSSVDKSFEEYKQNLTPIQRKMILDNDPNIKTVVVYDQSTGVKYFDVVNVQTGQSVPGVTRPAEILLEAMRIDARNGVAINSNVNQTYPLVIIGSRVADEL